MGCDRERCVLLYLLTSLWEAGGVENKRCVLLYFMTGLGEGRGCGS